MNNSVCWLDIPVIDLDRAIAFYSAVLGAPVDKQTTPSYEIGVLPHEEHAVFGCLCVCRDNQPSRTGPLVYLSTEGRLDAAADAVRTYGGEVVVEKHPIGPWGFRVVMIDSEGNRIALHSQVG